MRHTYGLWDQRQPRAVMPDAAAVDRLVSHRYFHAHVTPIQVLNRVTDPFLPLVRPHTLAVLADLDGRGLRNHVLVITRHQMKAGDIRRLNQLVNLKVTLLFTYSGIEDKRIEPYPSAVAIGGPDIPVLGRIPVDRVLAQPATPAFPLASQAKPTPVAPFGLPSSVNKSPEMPI